MTITIHKNAVSMWHPINGSWALLSQTIGDNRKFYTNGVEIEIPVPPYEDKITRLQQEIIELRQKLIDQQNYILQLDRRQNAEIQG